jgi:hypothetical protein
VGKGAMVKACEMRHTPAGPCLYLRQRRLTPLKASDNYMPQLSICNAVFCSHCKHWLFP